MSKTAQQNLAAGLALFLTADFFIVTMNAFAKGAAGFHNPVEILFYRSAMAMIVLLIVPSYGHKPPPSVGKRLYI